MACAKVQVCCLSIESEIPSSSNFNQSKLFYKLKNEIDSANRQINLQSNLIGLMERRVQHKTGCGCNGDNDNDKEFERNYRYWRRKLSKLKRDRKVANVNLYDLLFDLYRYLQTVETDKLTLNREREEESKVRNSENTEEEVVKPKRKYVTKRMLLQQQLENNKQRLDDKEQQLFECHFCTKKAKSKRSLVAHMVQAHKEEQIHFCDIDGCQERFSSPSLLRNHKLEQHTNVIECKKCHKFFNNRTILNKHRLSMHKLVCSVEGCAKICTTKRQMQQHLASHSSGGGLPTSSNEVTKRTRRGAAAAVTAGSNLDKKKYQVKPKKTFQCPKCSRTFTKAFDFKTHLKAVDCTKVWCCHVENCPEMFYKLKFLTEHCLTVHNEPVRFRCTWPGCNKMCNENRRLKSHYRVHTGERPYQCNWPGCDKRFKTSSCLCGHLKQHKNELKYSCPYPDCDYKANTNCTMRSHIRIRHEKKYYKRNRKKPLVNVNVVETNNSNGMDDTDKIQNQLNSTISFGQTQRKTNLTGTNSNTSIAPFHLTKLKIEN